MNECPKEKCFNWIVPGGSIFINDKGTTCFENIQAAINGKMKKFPNGGCAAKSTFGISCYRDPKNNGEGKDLFEPYD